MSPQPAVSSFLFCNISLAWQLLIFCASNQLQMSGGLSCVHLSLLSSHAHTGKPESLLFCHVNHSVGLVVLGLSFFGCFFFFLRGRGVVSLLTPSPCHVPIYLWHWRKHLYLIFSPIKIYLYSVTLQCFGYPISYMFILITTCSY